jgi:methylglyoxal synthase
LIKLKMKAKKKIAIVAHDNRKQDMVEWVSYNWKELAQHSMICTGTTGRLVDETIRIKCTANDAVPPEILRLKSGPLGGDQQLGAMISEGNVDLLFFLGSDATPAS